jgi:hypothetical protein
MGVLFYMQTLSSLPLNPRIRRVASTMSMTQGYSKKSVEKNIKKALSSGKPRAKALEMVLEVAKRAERKAKRS